MKIQVTCAIAALLQLSRPASADQFIGNVLQTAGNILGAGINMGRQQRELARQQQQEELESKVTGVHMASTDAKEELKHIDSEYKALHSEIAEPLASHVQTLKDERSVLMRKISALTKNVRKVYDDSHPEMVNSPLIIVAKSKSDEMRNVANKVDATGHMDILNGVTSPCADFHNSRQQEKEEIKLATEKDAINIELEAMNRMTPTERINYDRNMAAEYEAKLENIEADIKDQKREARRMGVLPGPRFPFLNPLRQMNPFAQMGYRG